ncbi:MAG: hypothetical protein EPN38_01525 [Rhodanobacteraceae bacterium]|nr:MAG: hypothetical protein EPN38_01525 [Rhodanobacteraceae bacterium]
MKTSGWVVAVVLATCGLALQGCAADGGVRDAADTQPVAATQVPSTAVQAAAAPAVAIPEDHGKPVVKADTKDNFAAIVAAIRQQMQPGGRWQYIDQRERTTIDGSFADMQSLYDQFGSVDKMDQAGKMRLLADQSTVNAILTRKDGDRLICRSEMPVGSHLPVRTCRTYAQVQAEERGAQQSLQKLNQQSDYQRRGGH